jgi:hypothetical protein
LIALESVSIAVGCHQEAHGLRIELVHAREEIDPGHARHPVIGQDQRHRLGVDQLEPALARVRRQDRELPAEHQLEDAEVLRLVVDVEDGVLAVVEQAIRLRSHVRDPPPATGW